MVVVHVFTFLIIVQYWKVLDIHFGFFNIIVHSARKNK